MKINKCTPKKLDYNYIVVTEDLLKKAYQELRAALTKDRELMGKGELERPIHYWEIIEKYHGLSVGFGTTVFTRNFGTERQSMSEAIFAGHVILETPFGQYLLTRTQFNQYFKDIKNGDE